MIPILAGAVFLLAWFARLYVVTRARLGVIDEIKRLSGTDIDSGRPWRWRFDGFDAGPSFDKMVLMFWVPASAFYRDAAFLKEAPK